MKQRGMTQPSILPPAEQSRPEGIQGAEATVRLLEELGVNIVFGIPGGAVLPLYDAIYDASFTHVLTRHEQGAALAADGYARITGEVGVCIATSGPGATNLLTGLATSYMDSVPVVAITGNVPRAMMGTDAFQEADTFGASMPLTKHNYLVTRADDLPYILREAFAVAREGRPGPVLIDIPKDVFLEEVSAFAWGKTPPDPLYLIEEPDPDQVEAAAEEIRKAERPVLYAGGGVITAGASDALRKLARLASIPTTTTVMALGAFPADDPLFLGMPGMHGTYAANFALTETDCLIAVGSRFDDRVTGKVSEFAANATIIHIDVDAAEHGKVKDPRIPIVADAKIGLERLIEAFEAIEGTDSVDHSSWLRRIERWKRDHPYRYDRNSREILPQALVEELDRATEGRACIVTGVGQHQMWAAMFYGYRNPRQFLTSGGLGTMGYCLPAAIGAQMGRPDAQVVCIDGDASFQMNVQELAVVAEYDVPLKIFIVNNHCHGMVRQWQHFFHGNRLSASIFQKQPDFVKLAEAYGIPGLRLEKPENLRKGIQEALSHKGPILIDCIVRQEENVVPMVPPGAAIREMIEG